MASTDQSITLTLSGEVTLPLFAEALVSLNDLLAAVSEQVGAQKIEWLVQDLAVGSAVATVYGIGEPPEVISRATGAAIVAALAVEEHTPEVLAPSVAMAAYSLTKVINGVVPELTLASGTEEVTITSESQPALGGDRLEGEPVEPALGSISAFGSLTGIVHMLSHARGITFSIRDEQSGRLLRSKVSADLTEDLRAVWDKRAVVEGIITRDSQTGEPVRLSEVTRIALVRDVPAGAFLRARGALRVAEHCEPPEATIRRMRDAS